MKISIILCTYNNADSLKLTLDEISHCDIPEGCTIELICVDNNSPDHTSEVLHSFSAKMPFAFKSLFEPNQGLSHARNLGLKNATGDYALFTDDDAKIAKHWISSYFNIIQSKQPDCLYSKISIVWDRPIPNWYIKEYQPFFVYLNYGDETKLITDENHEFFGKNFCVKKELLEEFGGFDPKLGRCGNKLIAGEETLIYKRLIKGEYKVIYFPNAEVGHRLKEREYHFDNIKKMYIDAAYSLFHISKTTSTKKIFARPIYPLKTAVLKLPIACGNIIKNAIIGNKNLKLYNQLLTLKYINTIRLWIQNP